MAPQAAGDRRGQRTAEPDLTAAVDLRDALIRALHMLPPQQRAAVVLRHWEQLSEAEAAGVLGCSEGTVKAAASRGLRRMRELAAVARQRFRADGEQDMNQEFDELVHDSMARFTDSVEIPPGWRPRRAAEQATAPGQDRLARGRRGGGGCRGRDRRHGRGRERWRRTIRSRAGRSTPSRRPPW